MCTKKVSFDNSPLVHEQNNYKNVIKTVLFYTRLLEIEEYLIMHVLIPYNLKNWIQNFSLNIHEMYLNIQ